MAVSLQKGQKISLEKEAGSSLDKVIMGLGWDVVKSKGFFGFGGRSADIDLDASCMMFDNNNNLLDYVYFRQLHSKDASIIHSGDNRTGAGSGDDEQIIINLSQIPSNIVSLVFTVNSFTGQSFAQVENARCRLINGANNQEIAHFNLSALGSHTAQIMAKVYRSNGEWKMHAIGETSSGRTFSDLIPQILPHL
jgi:tellurium resistance protein TerZ